MQGTISLKLRSRYQRNLSIRLVATGINKSGSTADTFVNCCTNSYTPWKGQNQDDSSDNRYFTKWSLLIYPSKIQIITLTFSNLMLSSVSTFRSPACPEGGQETGEKFAFVHLCISCKYMHAVCSKSCSECKDVSITSFSFLTWMSYIRNTVDAFLKPVSWPPIGGCGKRHPVLPESSSKCKDAFFEDTWVS